MSTQAPMPPAELVQAVLSHPQAADVLAWLDEQVRTMKGPTYWGPWRAHGSVENVWEWSRPYGLGGYSGVPTVRRETRRGRPNKRICPNKCRRTGRGVFCPTCGASISITLGTDSREVWCAYFHSKLSDVDHDDAKGAMAEVDTFLLARSDLVAFPVRAKEGE